MNEQHQNPFLTWMRGSRIWKEVGSGIPAFETLPQAVEALGSASLARRVAAIGALERVAQDSTEDHWTAIEALTAFLRRRSPWPSREPEGGERERADIQATISVLGRRRLCPSLEEAAHRLDLRHVDLGGVRLRRGQGHFQFAMLSASNLTHADLRHAELGAANLQDTDLTQANLGRANLAGAYLQRANLRGAKLDHANLWDAALDGADMRGATLRSAGLVDARLRGAELAGADLRGASVKLADFRFAKGLTCEQLTKAVSWQRAYRDERLACGATIPT